MAKLGGMIKVAAIELNLKNGVQIFFYIFYK